MTAHRWRRQRATTRGGAWCRPTLSQRDESELLAVSSCSNLRGVFNVAESVGRGSLCTHLRNLVYESSRQASVLAPATHSAWRKCPRSSLPCSRPSRSALCRVVRKRASGKSSRSGTRGCAWRKNKGLTFGSVSFAKAKWGKLGLAAKRRHQARWRARQHEP
jgi:hypothetical protein